VPEISPKLNRISKLFLSLVLGFIFCSPVLLAQQSSFINSTNSQGGGHIDKGLYISKYRLKRKKIRSVIGFTEVLQKGSVSYNLGTRSYVLEYDKNGLEVRKLVYDLRSSNAQEYTYKYDEKERLIESRADSPFGLEWFQYNYNEKGQMIGRTTLNESGDKVAETTFELNESDDVVGWKVLNQSGEDVSKQFEYNKHGQETVAELQRSRTEKRYDEKNGWLRAVTSYSEGAVLSKREFRYGSSGRLAEVRAYFGSEMTGLVKYKYDSAGQLFFKETANTAAASDQVAGSGYEYEYVVGWTGFIVRKNTYNKDKELVQIDRFFYTFHE